MLVFVSYCLRDFPLVKSLILQLGVLGHNVQYEPKMPAGQIRWSHVLESITACDVFVLALTDHALKSDSRLLELQYAKRLGKPVLPVLISDLTEPLPNEFSQALSYLSESKENNEALERTLRAASRSPQVLQPDEPIEEPDWRIPLLKIQSLIRDQQISLTNQHLIIWNLQEFLERQETFRAARILFKSFAARRDLDDSVQIEVAATVKQLKSSYNSQQRARLRNYALVGVFVLGVLVVAGFFLYRRQQAANREIEATQTERSAQITQTGFVLNKDMTGTADFMTSTESARQTQTALPTATMTQTPDARFIYDSIFMTAVGTPTINPMPVSPTLTATPEASDTPIPQATATVTIGPSPTATATLVLRG